MGGTGGLALPSRARHMATGSDPGSEVETSRHGGGPTAAAVQTPDGDTVGRKVGDRIKRDEEKQQQFTGRWGDQGKAGLTDARVFGGRGVLGGCAMQWSGHGLCGLALGSAPGPCFPTGLPGWGE